MHRPTTPACGCATSRPAWASPSAAPTRIVTDLTAAGYVVKHKDGRRNRYQIQAHLPLPEPASQEPAIGEVLALLIGNRARQQPSEGPAHLRP